MSKHVLTVLAVLLVALTTAGAQAPGAASVAADVATLRRLIQQTAKAINSNDAAGIMAHYSRDILVSYPGIPDTTHDVFERSYREMLSPNTATVTVPAIDEILVSGDLATIRMSWSTTITDKATGRSSSRLAKDLQVWRRESGAWKFFRGMWHHIKADVPAVPSVTDWPGLWGPSRNATTTGTLSVSRGVAQSVWRRPVDGGYAEIVVANGRAFTLELRDGADHIVALDAATGREHWSVRIGPTYKGHGGSDDGPISTPAVDGNDLFAVGPHGQLIAVEVATGRERWRHDLVRDYSATAPTWGFAASPLIDTGLVIVPTGGPRSRGVLAFDRATGRLRWNAAVNTATGYASAVAGTIAGVHQIVTVAADRVFGVRPADGQVLWSAPGPGSPEVSNSALLLPGDRILLSNWEESTMIKVEQGASGLMARQLWRSNRLRNANGPTIYRDGHLYGFAGPILVCMDAETQEIKWRERTGAGSLMTVGTQLVVLGDGTGEMLIADVSPAKFTLRHRLPVLPDGIRSVTGASFSDGRFYVRNLREVVAVRLQ